MSSHTGLCPGGSLRQEFEIFELSWNQTKLYKYELGHQRNQHVKYKPWQPSVERDRPKQFLEDFDNGTQNLAMGTSPYIGGC
jgi:hypothetical protein